ncbi:MAG: inositol monophosphatase family protein [Cyanobacteriota bacterium]|nr:inositol monophosphatase family protein [Cyanobacteriota bacterium]
MSTASAPALLDAALSSLIDQVAERQRRDFGQASAELKPDGTLVTACDVWSDQTIVQGLQALYPGEGILSEEGECRLPGSPAFWVVDPLDGTTNFAAGIPCWAISLARFEQGRPVLGILDLPPLGLRIVAKAGLGAWRNGVPLHPPAGKVHPVSCVSLCSRSITVLQKRPDRPLPGKVRMFGVASLNLVSVAMGQTVAALEATPKIWDLAAALLVLRELSCPMHWIQRDPAAMAPGTDLTAIGFPVLAAESEDTLRLYRPWSDALLPPV